MDLPDYINVISVFGFVSAVGALWAIREAYFALRSSSWPTAKGRVKEVGTYRLEGFPEGTKPHVRYEYTVSGNQYESRRIRFGGISIFSDAGVMSEITTAMGAREIPVHYDPRNPARSCLNAGSNALTLALPLFFVSVAIAALYFGFVWGSAM